MRDYFKSTFKDIVPDIALFSTHSLRAGGARPLLMQVWLTGFFRDMVDGNQFLLRTDMLRIVLESRLLVSKNLGI